MRIAMLLHKSVEFDSRVRREAEALVRAGHEVLMLELADVSHAPELDGFARRSVLPGRVGRRLPLQLHRLVFLLGFVREIARTRPEVVHAHDAAMLLPGLVGARLVGAKLVYDSHELATSVPYRDRGWAWFVALVERLVLPRCAAVITVSDGIAARLQERYRLPVRPTVVRNVSALRLGGAGGMRSALGVNGDAPIVLHQGAPAPDRGCEVLVDAAAELPDVHVVFLGDPEAGYRERLQSRIRQRGLVDRVSMLPSVPLDQLLAYTSEADVGITLLQDTCENHRLALPNKLFEYVAAGIPVIASALPETERLVSSYGIGWCVPPDRPELLAIAIRRALEQRDDPALMSAIARAQADLNWSREQGRLLGLYDELTGSREPNPEARPLALVLVRNSVSHDARVLRAARVAGPAVDGDVLVLGVGTEGDPPGDVDLDGIAVRRLAPWGHVEPLRRALKVSRRTEVGGIPRRQAPSGAADGARGDELRRIGPKGRLRRVLLGLAFILQAARIARRIRPLLVHANDWNTMWAGIVIKLTCRSALVYDSHELWADRNGRWEWRPWLLASEALFVRIADQVITTSPGYASTLAARYRVPKPRVVRNIPERKAQDRTGEKWERVVGYVGGLMHGRGLELAIAALPLIPDVGLRLIGPGPAWYRASLLGRARELDVADRVQLLDPVPPAEVGTALARCAAGLCLIEPVCLSYELSLPNKLFEYAAAGLPILASDMPVIGELVREAQIGVVADRLDPLSVADAARQLLDPTVRARAADHVRQFAQVNGWASDRRTLVETYRDAVARVSRARAG